MSGYLPTVKKEYEFEGDTITAAYSRLTRGQMIKISPHIPRVDQTTLQVEEFDLESNFKLLDGVMDALEENMKEFSGLKDAEGNDLAFSDICRDSYFFKLLSDMATDLMTESKMNEKK